MPPELSPPDRVRAQQQRHWDHVAPGWGAWLAWTERAFSPVSEWFVDNAGWGPGVRALDVACGAGYPSLLGATRLRPGGTMTATDLSPRMLGIALQQAAAKGIDNIEFRSADAEDLPFETGVFDTATNAYGLMFCPDPQRALAEAFRVLKPGGRVAFATWDEPAKSPFFSLITSLAAPLLALSAPDGDQPGPFRLASPSRLESMLQAVGFIDVHVESCPAPFRCASSAEYIQVFSDLSWRTKLATLPAADMAAFRDAVDDAVRPYVEDGQVVLTATSLCACGRKA